ncbi:MAG: response regulator transcription factor [Peredibacter sp.]
MNTILIVEDEDNLGFTLSEYLTSKGFSTHLAQSVSEARALFNEHHPNIILMDIGLPDGSGLDLAKELREKRKDFLLLFLSALNDPDTKLEGLEIGAEDYITKPFALKELTLRLEKSLQFAKEVHQESDLIEHGRLKIWFARFQVEDAHGKSVELGQKECAILKMLYQKRGQVVSREELIAQIWGEDKYPSNRTVDNYIVKLRKWCETDSDQSIEIQSIRGIGYKLNTRG